MFLLVFVSLLCIGYLILSLPYYLSPFFRDTHIPYFHARHLRGVWGEYRMFVAASRVLGRKGWLFHLYLPKPDRATTEVDAVLVHTSGIYVFECKNLRGIVRGDATDEVFTVTSPNGHSYDLYSPILQNETHCAQVRTQLPRALIHSIIVFGKDVTPDGVPAIAGAHTICTIQDLKQTLAAIAARTPDYHDARVVKLAESALLPFTRPPRGIRRRHQAAIAEATAAHSIRVQIGELLPPPPTDADAPPLD